MKRRNNPCLLEPHRWAGDEPHAPEETEGLVRQTSLAGSQMGAMASQPAGAVTAAPMLTFQEQAAQKKREEQLKRRPERRQELAANEESSEELHRRMVAKLGRGRRRLSAINLEAIEETVAKQVGAVWLCGCVAVCEECTCVRHYYATQSTDEP